MGCARATTSSRGAGSAKFNKDSFVTVRLQQLPCDDTLRWMSLVAAAGRLKINRAGLRIGAAGDRRMVRRLVREAIQAEREDSRQ